MTGRWPANVILSPAMAEVLDGQSGVLAAGNQPRVRNADANRSAYGEFGGQEQLEGRRMDSGGASRFFLQAGYEPWELDWILANGLRPCGDPQ